MVTAPEIPLWHSLAEFYMEGITAVVPKVQTLQVIQKKINTVIMAVTVRMMELLV